MHPNAECTMFHAIKASNGALHAKIKGTSPAHAMQGSAPEYCQSNHNTGSRQIAGFSQNYS